MLNFFPRHRPPGFFLPGRPGKKKPFLLAALPVPNNLDQAPPPLDNNLVHFSLTMEVSQMPAPDPLEMQQAIEATNLKALGEFTNNLVAGMGNVTLQASQNYAATMDALNKQLVSNLDFANKVMGTRLEVDPVEAAATSVILQQAAKAAQSTPPVTP